MVGFGLAIGLLPSGFLHAAPILRPDIVPQPVRVEMKDGRFELKQSTVLAANAGARGEAEKLAGQLRTVTGWPLPVRDSARGSIVLELDPGLQTGLGAEGYRLVVTRERVSICAGREAGLFYGSISLLQLLPSEAFASNRQEAKGSGWTVPCIEIEDVPRFAWRGLLLDPARHFFPPEFVKKLLDVMAVHKLNTLQLHLTDDQGWRLEIKQYPRLTEVGSVRAESPRKNDRQRGDGTSYGPFFYNQEEIRDLVAYAQTRHVTIVPEIELPGHLLAAVAAYPELSCRGKPVAVRTTWGVEPDILCAGNDAALAFAKGVLSEVCELFPGKFIHIGGDEAPRARWKQCPKCQARIKAESLTGEAQLQTWLNSRLEEFLASKCRRLIGWDEILEGGLTPGAAVMSWRGIQGGMAAAQAGHDVVMSPTSHCYFDYAQAKGPNEPESNGDFIPLEQVYAFEPVPAALDPALQKHVLGAQGNLWSEFLFTPAELEYFAFPRAVALAEVAWSPGSGRDYADFQRRLMVHLKRLDALKVNYRRPDAAAQVP